MSFKLNFKEKLSLFLLTFFSLFPIGSVTVSAHCPLCVAGAAFGITLTRWVGVDDSITGVWIGALLGSMSFWLYSWLLGKKWKFFKENRKIFKPLIYIVIFASTLWSFYKFQLIIRMSQLFGLDKLTFGMLTGSVVFYLVDILDNALIKKNGKVYFPYQRVVVSLGAVFVLSFAIYILINYFI